MEQTKAQEEQDASITSSVEFMMGKLATEGVFHYLPADKGDVEQTVSFANAMEECDGNRDFLTAMFELYREAKKHFADPHDTGKKLTAFIDAIDVIALGHAKFAADHEHGLIG